MSDVITPGTVAAEAGTLTKAIVDAFSVIPEPYYTQAMVGLARISNAIAVGVVANIVEQLTDGRALGVSGGALVGLEVDGGGGAPDAHAASHLSDGSDPIAAATTTVRGTVELATDGESASGLAVQANDTRLSNARTPTSHGSSHASDGSDAIPAATTSVRGTVELATDGESASGIVPQANDTRLSNARTPTSHASSHASDGGDPIAAATTSVRGTVELATDGESASGLAVQANDTRLSNARTPTAHGTSHASDGSDPLPIATTTVRGTVELATDGESAANLVPQANDSRLSNARTPTSHGSSHASDGSDPVPIATTTVRGTVELATDGESAANLVPQANDSRLSNARTPTAHATSHKSGGSDAIKLDELAATTDVTTLNSSTTAHGLLPKLSNVASEVLSGIGTWVPMGSIIDARTFLTPGTFTAGVDGWVKPTSGSLALILVWGAGGGGAGGGDNTVAAAKSGGCGGGGGCFNWKIVPLSFLAATETVVVGAGGAAGTRSTTVGGDGGPGGYSCFGGTDLIQCQVGAGGGGGGERGNNTNVEGGGGGGGGSGEVGTVGSPTAGGPGGGPGVSVLDFDAFGYVAMGGTGCRGGWSTYTPYNAEYGGGGGAGRSTTTATGDGGTSMYGGGGGGCGGCFDVGSGSSTNPSAGGASGRVLSGGLGGQAGVNGAPPTAGSIGAVGVLGEKSGAGGGGGGARTGSDGDGAAGGAGGSPAGGGGGGGHGRNSQGGLGGVGGDGAVRIYVF